MHAVANNGIALLEASTKYVDYVKTLCTNPSEETSLCQIPHIKDVLGGFSTDGIKLEGSLDLTSTYLDPTFTDYKNACVNAGGKMCYVNVDASGSGINVIPYELKITIDGVPLCSADICDEADAPDLVNEVSSAATDYYGDSFSDVSFEVTGGYTCDASTNDKSGTIRALRGALSQMLEGVIDKKAAH